MPTIDQQCKKVCSYCADYGDEDPLDDVLWYRFIEEGWYHGDFVCAASDIRKAAGRRPDGVPHDG